MIRVNRDGHQVTVRLVTRPDAFGHVAALTKRFCYSAQALTDTEALMLDAVTFLDVVASYPRVAQNVARSLANWLADSWERLDDLGVRLVDQRVARALLRCIAPMQSSARDEKSITLVLTHQELADIVGASVFTVSRVLSAWKSSGIVNVKRGRLVVQRPEALAAIAGSEMAGTMSWAGRSPTHLR